MRITLKNSTVSRVQALQADYGTEDVNELLHSALTELETLRRLTNGGLCHYPGGRHPGVAAPLEAQTISQSGGRELVGKASVAVPSSATLDDLSALLND